MPSKKNLKQRALLEHRIIMQAALCVEDLLQSQEKEAKCRPWMTIVEEHMKSLFRPTPVIRLNKTITKQDIKRTKELNAKYKWE